MSTLTTEQLLAIPLPERIQTGIKFLDDALGGGYVPGTVILITGVPGVGKSSLVMRCIPDGTVYNCNEESESSFAYKHRSVGITPKHVTWIFDKGLRGVFSFVSSALSPVLVVDSLHETSVSDPVRVAEACHNLASATGATVFLIGHVNKKGKLAGEERIRHWVDVHLHLTGRDIIEVLKNRFPPLQIEPPYEGPEVLVDEVVPPTYVAIPEVPLPSKSYRGAKAVWEVFQLTLVVVCAVFSLPLMIAAILSGHRVSHENSGSSFRRY